MKPASLTLIKQASGFGIGYGVARWDICVFRNCAEVAQIDCIEWTVIERSEKPYVPAKVVGFGICSDRKTTSEGPTKAGFKTCAPA